MHCVQVSGGSGGLREGSEAVLRSGVAVAGKGAFHVLQKLQPLLPSVLLSSAATADHRLCCCGGRPLPFLWPAGRARVQFLPLLWLCSVSFFWFWFWFCFSFVLVVVLWVWEGLGFWYGAVRVVIFVNGYHRKDIYDLLFGWVPSLIKCCSYLGFETFCINVCMMNLKIKQ